MQIRIKNKIYDNSNDHFEDLQKLQKLMFELGFWVCNLNDLEDMWYEISDKVCASWLTIPNTTTELLHYLEMVEV